MKNYTLPFITTVSLFSLSCIAQHKDTILTHVKSGNSLVTSERLSLNEPTIIAYHVEEKINMNFGGSTSTYTVLNLNLVNTNDLGPNNNRVITPKYAKAKIIAVDNELPKATIQIMGDSTIKPSKTEVDVSNNEVKYAIINILNTYERVLNKGYKSVDMLKKVGDKYYFDGDLEISAQWYDKLFGMTTDVDPVYYYRYAQSLQAVGQIDKAATMMKLYESKNQ